MSGAILTPVPASQFTDHGRFLEMIRPEDLVYFCLNEGDGDTQLLLLPQADPGPRQAVVVDVVQAAKLGALIDAIQGRDSDQPVDRPLLADPVDLPLVVATHPHDDHIRGMASFLRSHADGIGMFWEPGYRASTQAYMTMMGELADRAGSVQHVQPTSGTTVWLSQTRITALSPAIGLRNHFDTYGVDLNDASIGLRIEFPTSSAIERDGVLFYNPPPSRAALVLGADSQARSWSEILVDFPRLEASRSPIAKALREATGADHLAATVFKVSHHCSNRGSYLELIEKIAPRVCLVTADPYHSQHHFPHHVALEAIREARQSTAKGAKRKDDHELGIHVTGADDAQGNPLGSIAVVIGPGARKLAIWRFGDRRSERVVLRDGRRFAS